MPSAPRPDSETLKKIEHEYSLRADLDSAWAVRPLALSEQDAQITLVLEDPGGETLDGLLSGPMELTQFLRIAVNLSAALAGLHARRLIHKDLKPTNVLVDPTTGQVRLMGFGIASRLRREHQAPEPPEFIVGSLPYMAPEQTGRMNRSIDSRSDLYGLGITLYEMLTGELPFTAFDPIGWVHCHIAKHPMPPHERIKDLPAAISAIVMKLLAKTPEDRYQTASGVQNDLQRCQSEWEAGGSISDSPLGRHDVPDRLLIPEKLYGREREIQTLLGAFDRVVAGGRPELILVSGYSGIGKSSVVNELHKALVPPRALFASGKFDQYKRDIPYSTLAQALQNLTRTLLSKSEEELNRWRTDLHHALDPNGQLILALVPELKAIIGEQPPVPELPRQEAQHRFHLVFRRFINVFARPEHPLALFLDDLQWLDAATLDLVDELVSQPDTKYLMLIGAYRDNEVDAAHPLMRKLQAVRQAGASVQEIALPPLTRRDLEQLIADSLHCDRQRVRSLVELVHQKTTGNPFFSIQFISALVEDGMLTFDHVEGQWAWDLSRIRGKGYTDNVVEFMITNLIRLAPETQKALTQLACLGDSASLPMLCLVYGDSLDQMHDRLVEAVDAGFVFRSKDAYHFLHDRVREAAYTLIPEAGRAEAHLRIGKLLTAHTPRDERDERIFEIVNQLNRGGPLMTSRDEKEQLAEYNLTAGKRAKASTAYLSALRYLEAGVAVLGEDGWSQRRDLLFALEYNRAECEFLTGNPPAAEVRLKMLASRAMNIVERSSVGGLRIDLYTALEQADDAVEAFLDYLRHLGVEWSPHPTDEEARREYERIWQQLGSRKIEELLEIPLMTDEASLATLDVLTKVYPSALMADPNLLSMAICRAVNLSLEQGNSDGSCVAYVFFGKIAGPRFGNYKAGFRFGQVGYELVEKRGMERFHARTYLWFAQFVVPWTKHVRTCRDLIRSALEGATTAGDLTVLAYCHDNLNTNYLAVGDSLLETQRQAEDGFEFAQRTQFGHLIDVISTQLGLIRTLRGLTYRFGCFDDGQLSEEVLEQHFSANPGAKQPESWYWIRKLQARFIAGDHPSALEAAAKARPILWTSAAMFETAEYHYYAALSHGASCNSERPPHNVPASVDEEDDRSSSGSTEYGEHLKAMADHHRELEIWAENCPENFENRAALVGAEIARIEGRVLDAERLYERAIRSSHDNGFVHNEAIAYELASKFYSARGFRKFADAYLLEARYCYQRWGADGKVAQLDQLNPQLYRQPAPASTILAPAEYLDLATVIKVSQAVSGEMVLDKLIDSLMRAAIQQAGAERGLLVLPHGDQLVIEAEATSGENGVLVLQRDTVVDSAILPETVIRYVMRTQESVIVEDASSKNPFPADPFIVQHQVRSIICLPLINQRKLTGVLYLENNLAPRVFTPDRIAVLKVLASQAAISLKNTWLYRDLEDRERRIRRLIDSNVIGIVIWDLDGRILDANDAFLRMVGYERSDLQNGLGWLEITPPEWQEVHARDEAEELKATGMMQAREKEYFRKDGTRVPVLIGAACFEDQPNQGVAYIVDLSRQKSAEEALRRSEAYLAEAQRQTQTGSCAIDGASRQTVYWSEEMYRLFGFDPQKGPPQWEHFLERIHPEDREKVVSASDATFRAHANCDVEFRSLRPDGSLKYIHAIAHPVLDPSGQLFQVLGTMVDVTDRKRAEAVRERVRQLEADLAHTTRVSTMGELTASLAHEIKQPIGAAVTNAEACIRLLDRDEPDLPEAREAALEMMKDARRAADIVDRVRSLCQKGSSELQILDLNQVIDEMVAIMGDEANLNAVTMRVDLAPELPPAMADRVQLQQALLNLMRNGIEAMHGTGGDLTVKSRLDVDGFLLVSVSDNGVGLPVENQDRMFNAFFTTKNGGTGLGLAITRSIIQSHDGRIWAAANSEGGATFSFSLPAREAAA
ncbi:AAA family ATPase [Occallatibacter riparius]|uniref:histidine kinase n=1 Tax=Occallatibacter riparius TaxID=1002689 RepID=A0A9J7BPD5_9BACT|nr:AAA family ATPase [Occallatibacter riparius]UWZ84393.1 AAA family ATPase [Occallatibacter riparius]